MIPNLFKGSEKIPASVWKDKVVLVWGLGISGLSAVKLLHHLGAQIHVVDQGEAKQWKFFSQLSSYVPENHCWSQEFLLMQVPHSLWEKVDLVIIAPGIPHTHSLLSSYLAQGKSVWSEIELAYHFVEQPLVAVTGTNGKTTVVTLMGEIFKRSHMIPFVGGNIGTPFCDFALRCLKNEALEKICLLEVSSFQLETTHLFRPHVAIITNLEQNHEERYACFDDYCQAKFRLALRMQPEDILIYPIDETPSSQKIQQWVSTLKISGRGIATETIEDRLKKVLDLSPFQLKGKHNLQNLMFAYQVSQFFHVDPWAVQETVMSFSGVPHRLEYVPSSAPWKIYNDAKSTNKYATETAIKSFCAQDGYLALIIGGQVRDAKQLEESCWEELFDKVDKIFLIGESSVLLDMMFKQKNINQDRWEKFYALEDLFDQLKNGTNQIPLGGILLFSPGFPSFDQYQNYQHRGNSFKKLVNLLYPYKG
jgi:UDP-N-acetylmuramoylalanine--D-glutamate ligase